jgi:hypothetical protein
MTTYKGEAQRLWREVSKYQLDPAEQAILRSACNTQTEITRVEDELADADVMVEGSKRQLVPNPLFAVLTMLRKSLREDLRELALPIGDEPAGSHRSPGQRKKAKAKAGAGGLREVSGGKTTA